LSKTDTCTLQHAANTINPMILPHKKRKAQQVGFSKRRANYL